MRIDDALETFGHISLPLGSDVCAYFGQGSPGGFTVAPGVRLQANKQGNADGDGEYGG